MPRPKHTSELPDDPNKRPRQLRTMAISTVAQPSRDLTTRRSRIGVSSSNPKPTHGTGSGYSNVHLNTATPAQQGTRALKGALPKKTNTSLVQVTAETNPIGNPEANPNKCNDKKWVHERSKQIAEYLLTFPTIGGISSQFLRNGLQQMSNEQFVAIVNFFLSFVCGEGYEVGKNYVQDILLILRNLNYPHAANALWLKTPTTENSFGHVIVLLDYFMDFVPPSTSEKEAFSVEQFFELRDSHKSYISQGANGMTIKLDKQCQIEMLLTAEKGFHLWDIKMDTEQKDLQKATCEFLVKKTCTIPRDKDVQSEIRRLRKVRKTLILERRVTVLTDWAKIKSEKSQKLYNLRIVLRRKGKIYQKNAEFLKELEEKISELCLEKAELQKEIKLLITKVMRTEQLLAEETHFQRMWKAAETTENMMVFRRHENRILYSRVLQKFLEQKELFTEHLKEIASSNVPDCCQKTLDELWISLRSNIAYKESRAQQMLKIKRVLENCIGENKKKIAELNNSSIVSDLKLKLEPMYMKLQSSNNKLAAILKRIRHEVKVGHGVREVKIKKLSKDLAIVRKRIALVSQHVIKKEMELKTLKEETELEMQRTEELLARCMAAKRNLFEAVKKHIQRNLPTKPSNPPKK